LGPEFLVPNIIRLVDTLGGATPDPRDVQLRARYCREEELLPKSAKNPAAPQVETVHAVVLLLAVLAAGTQVGAPVAVRKLWSLPGDAGQVGRQIADVFPGRPLKTFGGMLAGFLELMIDGHMNPVPGKVIRTGGFREIAVWRDRLFGFIADNQGLRKFYEPDSDAPDPVPSRQIDTITTCPEWVLGRLAGLVAQSRMEARRLNVTIPTADTWRALGVERLEPPSEASPSLVPY
jgi:hypothetical protein